MRRRRLIRRASGFLVIAAVFLVVILAGLVVYMMSVSTTSQTASVADLSATRAYQAARAGAEWATFHIMRNPAGGTFKSSCEPGPVSPAPTFALDSTFSVKVECSSAPFVEGADSVRTYTITATGCNSAACPGTPSTTYVERQVTLTITK